MLSGGPHCIPRFAPHLAVAILDADTLLLQSESSCAVVRGHEIVALARNVDGKRSVAEIAANLGEQGLARAISYLNSLEQVGYLEASPDRGRSHPSPVGARAGVGASTRDTAVKLSVCCEHVDAPTVSATIAQEAPVRDGRGELHVIVCDDYLSPQVNDLVRGSTGAVLLAKVCGEQPTIGPLFDAEPGPCWRCLGECLAWNRPVQRFIQRLRSDYLPAPVTHTAKCPAAVADLIPQAIKRFAEGDHSLRASMLAFDRLTQEVVRHHVRTRPQCPECGDPRLMKRRAERQPALHSVPIRSVEDGGYRCQDAAQTLNRYGKLVSPLTGVVNYLHPMPGRNDASRHVYVSGYQVCPQQLGTDNAFDKICAGKGQSAQQAKVGALCEALERASSVWQGDEAVQLARRSSLSEPSLSLDLLQNFSERQETERDRINATTRDRRRQIPRRWDDDAVIGWTPAWSLSGSERCLVPVTYCFAETPPELGSEFGIYNPNGTAAGTCEEEAVLQGLLELVERDATAIWWYNRLSRPALNLDVLQDDFVQQLQREYTRSGWRLRVVDLTHDLQIPVYAAIARRDRCGRFAIGFGCHLSTRLAVLRALTELNQLLDQREDAPHPWDSKLLPEPTFLQPTFETTELHELPGGTDLEQDILTCLRQLARANLTAYRVDKTRPDFELAVVQVIVPGLRHFWPRFGPGRLYEVPLQLGWCASPTDELALNPAPLFL